MVEQEREDELALRKETSVGSEMQTAMGNGFGTSFIYNLFGGSCWILMIIGFSGDNVLVSGLDFFWFCRIMPYFV